MAYQDTKVYYDGSHYIAIPKRPAPRHRGARLEEDPVEVIEEKKGPKQTQLDLGDRIHAPKEAAVPTFEKEKVTEIQKNTPELDKEI